MKANKLTSADLIELAMIGQSRENFWCFLQYINNKGKRGWWQKLIAYTLQEFYEDLVSGIRPKLVIQAPPQHGKSELILYFLSWVFGKNPDLRTIYASFSERLGIRANLRLQRVLDSPKYKAVFPATCINSSNSSTISNQKLRNREILEFLEAEGYFRNTTVRGSITGESLDLGVIDDPMKGREEAGSKRIRDKTWDWFLDDFFTRFSEGAGFLTILTRWHVDDPVGRMQALWGDKLKTVTFPAIAVEDEEHRKEGDPLFPELKSIEFLQERKHIMSSSGWESLYQQNPTIPGGEIIHGEDFGRYGQLPQMKYRNVYADTAMKTKEHNDYSVFEEWGYGVDGNIYLINLFRKKMEAPELRKKANDFWQMAKSRDTKQFGNVRKMKIEDKASGTGLIQDIKLEDKIPVEAIQRHTDKYTRVSDTVGYIESGYVKIPESASWVHEFITECEAFTADDTHAFDDQIDPMCDAISDMLANKRKGVLDV